MAFTTTQYHTLKHQHLRPKQMHAFFYSVELKKQKKAAAKCTVRNESRFCHWIVYFLAQMFFTEVYFVHQGALTSSCLRGKKRKKSKAVFWQKC